MADNVGGRANAYAPDRTHTPPRRLSYASVASGILSQTLDSGQNRTYSGAYAHMAANSPHASHPPQYHSDPRPHGRTLTHDSGPSVHNLSGSDRNMSTVTSQYGRYASNIGHSGRFEIAVPSYLRHTRYGMKLEAAQRARSRLARDSSSTHGSQPNILAAPPNNPRLAPSHRGMTYDVIENNPPVEEDLMPLPTKWSLQDKYPGLEVSNDGFDVRYNGSLAKAELEAASIRANFPISPQCGIYYYEITIKQKNKDCAVAIGFSSQKSSLERLPGWEPESWAYHGDDGKAFHGEQHGQSYNDVFGMGDVIGCGINFHTGTAFFTKNGQDLGTAFKQLKSTPVFPCVGMKKYSGVMIAANFGQSQFLFDIREKMEAEEIAVRRHIESTRTNRLHPGQDTATLMQDLVAQYLSHGGFVETAKEFQQQVQKERRSLYGSQSKESDIPLADSPDAVGRQQLRQAILKGDIDGALQILEQEFPTMVVQSPRMLFKLKCRKWVEILAKAADVRRLMALSDSKNKSTSNGVATATASTVEDVFDQAMELDEDHQLNGSGKAPVRQSGANAESESPELMQLNQDALAYGAALQEEYGTIGDEYSNSLNEIFSLLPYADPRNSINGYLLDSSGRAKVAEEVNSAILESLGKPPAAALETTWRQAESLIEVLSQEGGPASFVNLQYEKDG